MNDICQSRVSAPPGSPGLLLDASVVDCLPVAAYLCDASGRIVCFNERARLLWGRKPHVQSDRYCGAFMRSYRGRPIPANEAPSARTLAEGIALKGELVLIERPDGTRISTLFHSSPVKDSFGEVRGVLVCLEEMPEPIIQAPEQVGDVSDFNEHLLASSQDCIKLLDCEGRLLFMSKGGLRAMDCKEHASLIGSDYLSFWKNPSDCAAARKAVADARAGGVGKFEGFCPTFSGQPKWWEIIITPIRGRHGEVEKLLSISRDITERKQWEEKLQQSELRLQRIINSNVIGMIVADFGGRVLEANDAFLKLVGYTREDLQNGLIDFFQLTPPEYGPLDQKAIAELKETGRHDAFEKEYYRKDGSRVPVLVGAAWMGGSEQVGVGFIMDLTARKQAEAETRLNEERYRAATMANSHAFWRFGEHGMNEAARDWWAQMTHQTIDEMAGWGWLNAVHPEDKAALDTRWRHSLETREPYEARFRVCCKDGTIRHIATRGVPLSRPDGTLLEWVGTLTDVTREQEMVEALRASEAKLQSIVNNAESFISVKDLAGRYILANPSLIARQQWSSPEAVLGRTDHELYPSETADVFAAHDQQVLSSGQSTQFEESAPSMLGLRTFVVQKFPLRDAVGQILGVCSIATDITQQKQVEDALRRDEERYRAVTLASSHAFWRIGQDGLTASAVSWWCDLTGQRPEEMQGDGWYDVIHPDDRERVKHLWEDSFVRRQPFHAEYRIGGRQGGWHYLQVRAVPLFEKSGELREWVGTFRDATEERKAQTARDESEQRLHVALQAARLGFWELDIESRKLFVSEQQKANFGLCSRDFVDQEQFVRLLHPEDRQSVLAAFESAVREHRFYEADYRVIWPDGTVHWIHSAGKPFYQPDGAPVKVIGVSLDITQRREAELELQRSRTQLESLMEHSPAVIFMKDLQGRYTFVNRRFLKLFGFQREQVLGKTPLELFPDAFAGALHQSTMATLQSKTPQTGEDMIVAEGRTRIFMSSKFPLLDAAGQPYAFCNVAVEITELKETEQALRKSEQRFRRTFESNMIPMGVWRIDGVILDANDALLNLVGYTREDLRTGLLNWRSITPEMEQSLDEQALLQIRHNGICSPFEKHYRHKSGRLLPILLGGGSFGQPHDEGIFFALDLTALKSTEVALREAQAKLNLHAEALEKMVEERTERLQDTIEELEAFSYSISHDMRGPLRAMQGYAAALKEDYGPCLDQHANDYLARIARGAHRLDKLIQDVLTYSRVAQAEVHLNTVEPSKLLADIIQQYPGFQSPTARIYLQEPLPAVVGQEASLTQVFSNLLGNAVKFVPQDRFPEIRIWSETRGGWARIWIEDNGIGVAAEHLERIFNIFDRGSHGHHYDGTGIGLSIVRKAVERMGGSVGVVSEPGKGSRFWIELRTP